MKELHKVTSEELPAVSQWLKGHLPESWKIFGSTREILNGRWQGHVFYTLGWPDIRAVVEDMDEPNYPCPTFWKSVCLQSLYAPDPEDIEILLHQHIEWTKPITFVGLNETSHSIVQKVAKEKDLEHCCDIKLHQMEAYPGDIEARPIPEGYKLRPIDPEVDAEYCARSWFLQAPGIVDYFKALMARLPNACLAHRDNQYVCFEMGTDYGNIGMLHTHEDYRRRGLGNVLVSNLVQEYFKDGLPAVVWIDHNNEPSIQMHQSLGFKKTSNVFSTFCFPKDFEDKENDFIYKFLQALL